MEDLKQAILDSQVEDSALGTRYSRYYTAIRLTNGTITVLGEPDRSAGEATIRLAHSTGYQTRGDFVEGIVYDTVLGLTVYHLHATQGQKAPQTFLGSERSTLINSIRRDWVDLNEQMTLISERSEPKLLAYIAAMRKKLQFLSATVSIERGLAQAAAGDTHDLGSFADSISTKDVTVLLKDGRPIGVLDKDSMEHMSDRGLYIEEWRQQADDSEVTKLYVATPAPLTLTSYTIKRTPFNPSVGMRYQVVKTVESLISQPFFQSYGDAIRYAESLATGEAEES